MAKLHQSKAFLFNLHHKQHKNLAEIARICGVDERTIRRKMQEFGIPIRTW